MFNLPESRTPPSSNKSPNPENPSTSSLRIRGRSSITYMLVVGILIAMPSPPSWCWVLPVISVLSWTPPSYSRFSSSSYKVFSFWSGYSATLECTCRMKNTEYSYVIFWAFALFLSPIFSKLCQNWQGITLDLVLFMVGFTFLFTVLTRQIVQFTQRGIGLVLTGWYLLLARSVVWVLYLQFLDFKLKWFIDLMRNWKLIA